MIDRLFGRYKNIFLVLLSVFIIAVGLRNTHSFYQDRIMYKKKEIEEKTQAIKSAQAVKLKQVKLSRLSESFISPDSYKFISTVGGFAAKAGLEINSLRYVHSRSFGTKGEEGPVSRLAVALNAEGGFKNMLKFLTMLEDSGLTITVMDLRMQTKRGEEEKIIGDMRILGLAFKEK